MEDEPDAKTPRKRNIKDLPIEISCIRDTLDDRSKFVISMEIDPYEKSKSYGQEFAVAQSIRNTVDDEVTLFHLNSLSLDHIRRLCRIMKVSNIGSSSKYECRKKLGAHIE